MAIIEKKLDKKVQAVAVSSAEKKKDPPKITVKAKAEQVKGSKQNIQYGEKTLYKQALSALKNKKEPVKEEKEKKPVIKLPINRVIKSNVEAKNKPKVKLPVSKPKENKKEIKKNIKPKMVNNLKFGKNAHRAVITDRDSALIVSPKLNEKQKSSILSDYRVQRKADAAPKAPVVVNTSKPAVQAASVMPTNGKSVIDFICEPDCNSYTSDTNGIIVTMTSWPKRIKNVEKTLRTILDNSTLPEKIIVNLSTEEFPGKETNLPNELVLLAKKNPIIEFHWLKHNTTVWKKIIPTLIRFKNANVICIDDDRLYPKDFIATFKSAANKYPSGPITGANISFHKKFKQHCGHASLDKYIFYKDGLDFITKEVMDLRSSDSVFTIIANMTGHATQYLGVNYLTLIPQKNNPVFGYSSGSKISVTSAIRTADSLFSQYLNKNKSEVKAKSVPEKVVVEQKKTTKSPRIALCGLAKNENLYIREWVEHYLKIGVDTIFLYDNNDINGERFDEVIDDYIKSGKVVICNVRGEEKAFRNKTKKLLQERVYEECYNKNKTSYDWFFFFDIDEFLCITDGSSAKTFLSLPKFNDVTTILVNWMNYGDSGNVRYDNRPIQERFTKPGYDVKWLRPNTQCKTILRGGNKKLISTHTHKLQIEGSVIANADGKILDKSKIMRLGPEIDEKTYKSAYLKHYVTKTIEEYLIRYTGRGKIGTYKNKDVNDVPRYSLTEVVNNFFMINEKTKEKLDVVKEFENGNVSNDKIGKVIVSLTSYKPRIGTLHKVIESLLDNTMKPYKIVLTLYKGDEQYITKELRQLEKDKKIEIIITDEDLKPHKKYLYTMQKYKDFPVITVDDDVIYQKNLISILYNGYLKNPNCVCCMRSRQISFINKKIRQYRYWKLLSGGVGPSQLILPTGVGGIIYPPGYLKDYNMDDIRKFISTDDIYLYYLTIRSGMKNVQLSGLEKLNMIDGSQEVALYSTVNNINSSNGGNDIAANELIENRLVKNNTIKL